MEGIRQLPQHLSGDSRLVIQQVVDHVASLKKVADDQLGLQVIVHRVITTLRQSVDEIFRLLICLLGDGQSFQVGNGIHQPFQSLLAGLQSVIGEVYRAAIVG